MASIIPISELPVITKVNISDLVSQVNDWSIGFIFLVDKPKGYSSFKVIGKLRKLTNFKKIGHAGTLDPMATGLVICCIGKATKSISQIQDLEKVYKAVIRFGASTPSYDAETEIDHRSPFDHVTLEKIVTLAQTKFVGQIKQTPPMYSALKKDGQPLYKLARKGKTVERKERDITIHSFSIINFDGQNLECEITCSKGTYIRSIAHDLGIELESRAYLTSLRRTRTGTFSVDKAITFNQIDDLIR